MAKNDDLYLTGTFTEISTEIAIDFLKPGLIFRVDHFFLDHWLPLLGPSLAWLVVALQQACWHGGRPGNTAEISQAELGRQCGLSRQRVNQLLNHEPLLEWFLPEVQRQAGPDGQTNNRYRVFLNSPPTPALVAGLRQEIENRLAGDEPLPEIVRTLTAQAKREQADLLVRLCAGGGAGEKPQTVTDVVAAFAGVMDPDLQEAAGELSRALLQPKQVRLETQYFRRKWLPELGATAAWLVVYIRRHCYADKDEVRDAFSMRKTELRAALGISTQTLRRTLKTPILEQFFVSLDNRRGSQSLAGRIRMRDPLTPADATSAKELTRQQAASAEMMPETDQNENSTEPKVDTSTPQLDQKLTPQLDQKLTPQLDQKLTPQTQTEPKVDTSTPQLDQKLTPIQHFKALHDSAPDDSAPTTTALHGHGHEHTPAPACEADVVGGGVVDVIFSDNELKSIELSPDQIILETYQPESETDGYRLSTIEDFLKQAIREAGDFDRWLKSRTNQMETVRFSVDHALKIGGTEWTPEERERIGKMDAAERRLGAVFERLGGFDLADALGRYFSTNLAQQYAARTDTERVEAWLVYTRRQEEKLKNPPGFLRSKLDGNEYPPTNSGYGGNYG